MRFVLEAHPGELVERLEDLHRTIDKMAEQEGAELHKARGHDHPHAEDRGPAAADMPFEQEAMEGAFLSATPVVERLRSKMMAEIAWVIVKGGRKA
jgi:hypothetical protein